MKAIRCVVRKTTVVSLALICFLFSAAFVVFAEADAVKPATQAQIEGLEKKLEESRVREEKILAGQEKILEEILISRKWAKRK